MQVTAAFEPAIVARDMEAMLAFYRGVLGMSLFSLDNISQAQARSAGLTPGAYSIARLETSGGDRLKIVVPQEPPTTQAPREWIMQRQGFGYLTFIVPDLAAVMSALAKAGATMRTGAQAIAFRPGVVELAIAQDPEGNCIEFVQRNDLATYRPARTGAAT